MNKQILTAILFFLSLSLHSQNSFTIRGIGGGGALFFPTINPSNSDEFYIACDMSQLFHSTDFGLSYTQSHFSRLTVQNNSTYEFTKDSKIAYTNFNDGNDGYPVRTEDGGSKWIRLEGFDANEGKVYKMRANYDRPEQIIINYYGLISISNDYGQHFTPIKRAVNNGVGIILSGVFFDGNVIFIATNEGLFRSQDGGLSFAPFPTSGIPAGQVIWDFSAAKESGSVRFVCITGKTTDIYNGLMPYEYSNVASGVYIMNNLDTKWISKSSGINFSNDFILYSGMAKNNIHTIYLAGNDASLGAPLIFKSENGGDTWQKVFKSSNNTNIRTGWSGFQGDKNWSWGETAFGIAVAPDNADRVLFGDYSFVHVSKDGGANWSQAYVKSSDEHPANAPTPKKKPYHSIGLENTTCWQIFWTDPMNMFGCFSDIGLIRSQDGGLSWGYNYDGLSVNSLYRMISGANGTLYAASSNIHDMYQSTRLADGQLDAADANGKISYSTDNGQTWSSLHQFNHPVFWIAADPTKNTRMYASVIHYGSGSGMGGIWVSDDINKGSSSSWVKLPNPPRTEGHPATVLVLKDGQVLCTYSGRRNGSGQFTKSSGLYLYNPASGSWKDLSDPGMYYWTKDVVVDPSDSTQSTWLVAVFSGWGGAPNGLGGLYRTTNRGQTWTKLTGTQFDRVTSVTFDPQQPKVCYLTTETQGLWRTLDISGVNPIWSLVNAYDFRQPERVYFNPFKNRQMWVSSFGNGMKFSDLDQTTSVSDSERNPDCNILTNLSSEDRILINQNDRLPFSIYSINGAMVYQSSDADVIKGFIDISSLTCGVYLVSNKNCVQKLIRN
ncbi:MAG: hypothetical protein K1X68_03945 [Saprospiraceae bacterium]|nr:hypothetical protein [Saprospiraceae bacterium]HMW37789.1 hypothetical protein [Saprospiraceae bacterium]HMX87475.1 hypothetical protein [Saprospiraceae bacterium]HMZ39647.1 hypothetical protein [Saprospiraceae bacterium]HNA63570.1 hypothetical protein [Saprospiraceae bacterium]